MSIIKAEKLEIEIQEQKIKNAGCKYLILIKNKEKLQQKLTVITTNQKPIIKSTKRARCSNLHVYRITKTVLKRHKIKRGI